MTETQLITHIYVYESIQGEIEKMFRKSRGELGKVYLIETQFNGGPEAFVREDSFMCDVVNHSIKAAAFKHIEDGLCTWQQISPNVQFKFIGEGY